MQATKQHIDKVTAQAKDMVARARLVNAAQYAHGINASMSVINHTLKRWNTTEIPPEYDDLNILQSHVMQLGGYLYSLKEGL